MKRKDVRKQFTDELADGTYLNISTLVNFGADAKTVLAYSFEESPASLGVALSSLLAVAPAPVGVEDEDDERTPVCIILLNREETLNGRTEGTADVDATGAAGTGVMLTISVGSTFGGTGFVDAYEGGIEYDAEGGRDGGRGAGAE